MTTIPTSTQALVLRIVEKRWGGLGCPMCRVGLLALDPVFVSLGTITGIGQGVKARSVARLVCGTCGFVALIGPTGPQENYVLD